VLVQTKVKGEYIDSNHSTVLRVNYLGGWQGLLLIILFALLFLNWVSRYDGWTH